VQVCKYQANHATTGIFHLDDTPASVGKCRTTLRVYLYWPLLTSIVVNDIRATALMLVRIYQAITCAHATTISHIVLKFVDLGFFTVMDIVMHGYNELTRSAHSFVVEHTSSVVIINPL